MNSLKQLFNTNISIDNFICDEIETRICENIKSELIKQFDYHAEIQPDIIVNIYFKEFGGVDYTERLRKITHQIQNTMTNNAFIVHIIEQTDRFIFKINL